MAETVTLGGVNYTIPDPGDQPNWATGLTPYLVAVAANIQSAPAFMQPVSVSATPTTTVSGKTYLVTTSSIAITLNLPAPATNMWLIVKDISGSAVTHNITLHRPGSQTIDGIAADKILSRNFGAWIICSDGTNYFVLNEFPDTGLLNTDIATGAAIAYAKLALTGSILNADINASAAIAYSKLALTGSIVNTDVNAAAAISYSKLVLTGSVVNADIGNSAAITLSKLAALTGLSASVGTISATDTILTAFGKIINSRIVQIITATTASSASAATTTFVDTNLTATITPTNSTNQILCLVSQSCEAQAGNPSNVTVGDLRILGAGSTISTFTRSFGVNGVNSLTTTFQSFIASLDTPASTSARIYKTQVARNAVSTGGTVFVQDSGVSLIILIEIGA